MKVPASVKKMLENKYLLYVVFFLAIANVLGYLALGNYKAIALFVLIGYLVHIFNKNMIVVLGVPLILTSILSSGLIREGAENMEDSVKKTENNKENKTKDNKEDVVESKKPQVAVNESGVAVVKNSDKQTTDASGNTIPSPNEKFTTVYNKKNNRVDYAATVEDAYGDLNKILGGDGIKNLTADTQKLMNQQLQLAEAMKSMTPLLDQAKNLMNGFDMKNFGNIAEMAKQFKASG
jgi:hypothetical protein